MFIYKASFGEAPPVQKTKETLKSFSDLKWLSHSNCCNHIIVISNMVLSESESEPTDSLILRSLKSEQHIPMWGSKLSQILHKKSIYTSISKCTRNQKCASAQKTPGLQRKTYKILQTHQKQIKICLFALYDQFYFQHAAAILYRFRYLIGCGLPRIPKAAGGVTLNHSFCRLQISKRWGVESKACVIITNTSQ